MVLGWSFIPWINKYCNFFCLFLHSRKAFTAPLKHKYARECAEAIDEILSGLESPYTFFGSDAGGEFLTINNDLKNILEVKHKLKCFTLGGAIKSGIVERSESFGIFWNTSGSRNLFLDSIAPWNRKLPDTWPKKTQKSGLMCYQNWLICIITPFIDR